MSNSTHILLVDDDKELCSLLGDYLRNEGYTVDFAHSAEEAMPKLKGTHDYSLVVLDVMMPGKSGLEFLQDLRPSVVVPVIMLTGRGEDIDRILGLEMGADDYMSKPANPRELLARIKAVMRRSLAEAPQELGAFPTAKLVLGELSLDPGTREVELAGQHLVLTGTEFNVLAYLMNHAGQVLSKDQLTEWVLHRKLTPYDRAIDVHVSRVRQKLAKVLDKTETIKTVRGLGYQFVRPNV